MNFTEVTNDLISALQDDTAVSVLSESAQVFKVNKMLRIANLLKPKILHYVPPALTYRNSVFCPKCIYVFCVDLRTNSGYFPIQH